MIRYSNTLGGGGGLGIKLYVKQFASLSDLPAKAKENTLAIIFADIAIQDTYLGVELPADPKVGTVFVNTSSVKAGDNTVEISEDPVITAVQINSSQVYDGTKWVGVPARLYKDGKWLNVTDLYLFSFGDQYKDTTGGFVGETKINGEEKGTSASYTINDSLSTYASSTIYRNDSRAHAYIRTRMNIDLSLLKAIKVRIVSASIYHNDNGGSAYCRISCGGAWGFSSGKSLSNTVISIPISETLTSAQFEMYSEVIVAGWREESANASLTISEMWGEFR